MKKECFLLTILFVIWSCVESGRPLCPEERELGLSLESDFWSLLPGTSDFDDSSCALMSLTKVDSVYRQTQELSDTLLSLVEAYYLTDGWRFPFRSRTVYQLYKAVSLYNSSNFTGAFRELLALEPTVEHLHDSYLSGVFHYYLGRIYQSNGLPFQALGHFRQERFYALRLSDLNQIAKSDHHCALSFLRVKEFDSCRYYMEHSLLYLPELNVRCRKMVFNNILLVRQTYLPEWDLPVEDYFSELQSLTESSIDTCRVYFLLMNYYYSLFEDAKADSFFQWGLVHEHGHIPFSLSGYLYCRRSGYSAKSLQYYELYVQAKSLYLEKLRNQEVTSIEHDYRRRSLEHRWSLKLLLAVLLSLFGLIFLIVLFVLYRRRQNRHLLSALEAYRTELSLSESRFKVWNKRLLETQGRLSVSERARREGESRITAYRTLLSRMLHRFMLRHPSATLSAPDFTLLVDEYAAGSESGGRLVSHLRSRNIRLSDRDIFICILFYEHKVSQQDMPDVICTASRNALKSAKSKIKSRLLSVKDRDPVLERLLEKF